MINKPELLAPAGDMECFKAAINAGADAVYLGGTEFGARAYASNFSEEELCYAISYAHLFGVKVYLTVNTVVKQREFNRLHDFLKPFYEDGLDGVIIQDFGVLKYIKDHFPGIELHASTQMCVTNHYGARLLKDYGVCRIVPARELSIDEIINIKKETGIDIECFIHGAMCYCYSGQCLFSSFLGGRSGNRGRCAGPCRLPYEVYGKKELYPLSLKDMCTISKIGELIDAGVDSFKIEGRMKNPYYVAGVTSLYRKYIDLYLKEHSSDLVIDDIDLNLLKKLYIRTELEDGYLHRHNGKEMVTISKPGYASADEKAFSGIKQEYLDKDRKIGIYGELIAHKNEVLSLTVWNESGISVTVSGNEVISEAKNRPITSEDVKKQVYKTGNTPFCFSEFSVIMDDNVFISLKAIGEARRNALDLLQTEISKAFCRESKKINVVPKAKKYEDKKELISGKEKKYHVYCTKIEQFNHMLAYVGLNSNKYIQGIEINALLIDQYKDEILDGIRCMKENGVSCYIVFPAVFRKKASDFIHKYGDVIFSDDISGYYCNNLDSLAYIKEHAKEKLIFADYALYSSNRNAVEFLGQQGVKGIVSSYELTHFEWLDMRKDFDQNSQMEKPIGEYLVYAHLPFMQTANCVKKTFGKCNGKNEITLLKDRTGKNVYVYNQCEICENTVYNGVPLSLANEVDIIDADILRIAFTVEDEEHMKDILDMFFEGKKSFVKEFTKGHFKKGIE